jgi:hypothetical protein
MVTLPAEGTHTSVWAYCRGRRAIRPTREQSETDGLPGHAVWAWVWPQTKRIQFELHERTE